ncbi:MAG: phospholipase A [Desulfobacterales bacterium]|nr:phospholipase A [Desulfobacterales bacterium]
MTRKHINLTSVFSIALAVLFSIGLTPPPSFARSSELWIVPPQGEATAGTKTGFTLFIRNPDTRPLTTTAYARLMVTLKTPADVRVVEAAPVNGHPDYSITIPAQGFAKQDYAFILPEQLSGNITLSIEALDAGPVLFAAAPMPVEMQTEQVALGEKESVFQPFLENLSAYEPMYFLLGADPGKDKSKFQVSFRYKLFNEPFDSQMVNGFMDGFHLAYTQTSHWDLSSDSKPFDDTSYKPELFYLIPKIDLNRPWVKAFGVKTGFQHESNGKGGDDSRSTNFAYVEPIMAFHLSDKYYLALAPKLWTYVGNDNETNPDLFEYRGYFDFQVKLGTPEGFVLDTHTRWAEAGPSFQTDLTYPLTSIFKNRLNLYLHLQYFNGYAERLVEYQEKEEIIRLGVSITR